MSGTRTFVRLSSLTVLLTAMVVVHLAVRGLWQVPDESHWGMPGASPALGRQAIIRHGCGACHVIPGIRTAGGRVGPQLLDYRNQIYVAGILANRPENLAQWIQDPRRLNPQTAMPDLGVSELEAYSIAAYLYENP